ncbi:MAG TPA: hypothetical protein VGH42_02320 [Verrucomicrobiae bacterium]|jgi:uncharacterized membrane protein YfcA
MNPLLNKKLMAVIVAVGTSIVAVINTASDKSMGYQAHPVAAIAGSLMPGLVIGGLIYLWACRKNNPKQKT